MSKTPSEIHIFNSLKEKEKKIFEVMDFDYLKRQN